MSCSTTCSAAGLPGGAPAPTRTTAFPQQPEVLAAAGIQLTQVLPSQFGSTPTVPAPMAAGPTAPVRVAFAPGSAAPTMPPVTPAGSTMPTAPIPTAPIPTQYAPPPYSAGPAGGGPSGPWPGIRPSGPAGPGTRPPIPARPNGPSGPPPRRAEPRPEPPPRRRGATLAITLLAVAILVLAGTVAAVATGLLKLPGSGGSPGAVASNGNGGTPTSSAGAQPSGTAGPTVDPTPSVTAPPDDAVVTPGWLVAIDDRFPSGDSYWPPASLPAAGGECSVDGQLTASLSMAKTVAFRCRGISNPFTDVAVKVNVELGNVNTCAGLWFRYSDAPAGGYALKICRDRIQIVTHADKLQLLQEYYYAGKGMSMLDPGVTADIGLRVEGNSITLYRDGKQISALTDDTFARGRVVLGVFGYEAGSPAPYEATFHRVQIFTPPS